MGMTTPNSKFWIGGRHCLRNSHGLVPIVVSSAANQVSYTGLFAYASASGPPDLSAKEKRKPPFFQELPFKPGRQDTIRTIFGWNLILRRENPCHAGAAMVRVG